MVVELANRHHERAQKLKDVLKRDVLKFLATGRRCLDIQRSAAVFARVAALESRLCLHLGTVNSLLAGIRQGADEVQLTSESLMELAEAAQLAEETIKLLEWMHAGIAHLMLASSRALQPAFSPQHQTVRFLRELLLEIDDSLNDESATRIDDAINDESGCELVSDLYNANMLPGLICLSEWFGIQDFEAGWEVRDGKYLPPLPDPSNPARPLNGPCRRSCPLRPYCYGEVLN